MSIWHPHGVFNTFVLRKSFRDSGPFISGTHMRKINPETNSAVKNA